MVVVLKRVEEVEEFFSFEILAISDGYMSNYTEIVSALSEVNKQLMEICKFV